MRWPPYGPSTHPTSPDVVASQQVVEAVAGLEPRSRALLELAPRRGMSDADIAALLGVRPAEVQRLREQAALELAAALELNPDKLDVLEQELRRLDEADWERRAVPRRRPRIAVAGAVLLVLAGITAAVVPRENRDRLVAATTTIGPRSGPAVGFQRLNGTYGHGSVRLIRDPVRAHLRLRVADFPRPQGGGYTVWLYSSPADAHRL